MLKGRPDMRMPLEDTTGVKNVGQKLILNIMGLRGMEVSKFG
jgi:hypothetical protein